MFFRAKHILNLWFLSRYHIPTLKLAIKIIARNDISFLSSQPLVCSLNVSPSTYRIRSFTVLFSNVNTLQYKHVPSVYEKHQSVVWNVEYVYKIKFNFTFIYFDIWINITQNVLTTEITLISVFLFYVVTKRINYYTVWLKPFFYNH